MASACSLSHLVAMVLMAGPLVAEIRVEAWYHLSDNAFPQDASGNQRHFRSPMPGYTHASADAAGGPLGSPGYLSMASLEFGRDGITGYWNNGYTAPDDNLGIEAWVKPFGDGRANPGHRFGWIFATGGLGGLNLYVAEENGAMTFAGGLVNSTVVGESAPLNAGRWTHLALVRDRGVTTFYVNGVRCGEPSHGAIHSAGVTDAVHLGVTAQAAGGFKGLIDETRLFTFAPGAFRPDDLLVRRREATGALPVTEEVPVSNYQVKTWQSDAGLPQNTVTAITQTSDGYLWVGTLGGLARFDGGQFKVFNATDTPALGSGRIRSLGPGHNGTLWIVTEEGAVVRYADGAFATQRPAVGPDDFVRAIEAPDGALWLSTADGKIVRSKGEDEMVVPPGIAIGPGLSDGIEGHPVAIVRDGIRRVEGERLLPVLDFKSDPASRFLCAGAGKSYWFERNGEIRQWRAGGIAATAGRPVSGSDRIGHAREDHGGRIWLAIRGAGVLRKDTQGGELTLTTRDGLGSDDVRVIFEDRGGAIWIGTDGGGLSRLNPPLVTTFGPEQGLPAGRISGLCPGEDETLWAAIGGSLCQFRGITPRVTPGTSSASTVITALIRDRQGRFFGGSSTTGLWMKGGADFTRPTAVPDASKPVRSLFLDASSRLWVGRYQTRQLVLLEDDKASFLDFPADVPVTDVTAMAQEKQGGMWVGTDGQGLLRRHQDSWQRYSKSDGLGSDMVWSLHSDEEGALWVGTFGGGLSRVKEGKVVTCTTLNGLGCDTITRIEDDGRGYFWCGSQQGVFRVKKSELNEFADGQRKQIHCMSYGIADGLPSLECTGGFQPAGCQTSDGRIWFPTLKGVAMVNPSAIRPDPLPPSVQVDGMTVDGEFHPLAAGNGSPLAFTTGHHRFRVHYAGIDFTSPESLRFRTLLDGMDPDWRDVQREQVADYSQLAAGHYVFRVQAQSRDGVWSEPGAAMFFEVYPRWHERSLVRAIAVLAVLGAVTGIVSAVSRAKLRRRLAYVQQLRMVEIERQRIAANIHDDLGASLTRIALLSDLARDGASAGGVGEEVEQIHDTAREMTRAMDEIVWAVDPEHDTLESLAGYLARVAQGLLAPAGIRCRLAIPPDLPDFTLSGRVRHSLYLAVKEALHNAIRHAAATEVRLALEVEAEAFTVIVSDNGKGIGESRVESGRALSGHGVANLSKRMSEIGGGCEITSEPGKGTEVQLHLPFRAARHHQN